MRSSDSGDGSVQKIIDWCLPFIFVAGLMAIFFANPYPAAREELCQTFSICIRSTNANFWNNIAYEIGLAGSASVFFYWLLVKVPDFSKRNRLRAYLLSSYQSFRRDAIFQLLSAANRKAIDYDLIEGLQDQSAFKEYFEQPSTQVNGDRWHDVANGLNAHHRQELFLIMSILRDDILYVLNNTDISDKETFSVLHRVTKALAAHDPRSEDYDDDKVLLRLFWQIMAGWNPIKGYEPNDTIARIIRSI